MLSMDYGTYSSLDGFFGFCGVMDRFVDVDVGVSVGFVVGFFVFVLGCFL